MYRLWKCLAESYRRIEHSGSVRGDRDNSGDHVAHKAETESSKRSESRRSHVYYGGIGEPR